MARSQDSSSFGINMKNTKILIFLEKSYFFGVNCEKKSIEKIAQFIFPTYKPSIKKCSPAEFEDMSYSKKN